MEGSEASLTQFLLDLTEEDDLSREFGDDPQAVIAARGLERFADLLVSNDVDALRAAVRAEITTGEVPDDLVWGIREPPPEESDPIIAGIRVPPYPGVREPPPEDE